MLAKILGGTGRVLMTAGTLILLFVAYQLWGTGLQEAKSQKGLTSDFNEALADVATSTTTTIPTTTTLPGQPPDTTVKPVVQEPVYPLPNIGDPVAQIRIPKIGITRTVVEGTDVHQLARGPAHYPATPLPGQKGNVAIAGHRTTYGQPFHNVDKLEPGDQIFLKTLQGDFVYIVSGTEIVKPSQVEVLEDKGDNRLTLTACHPKYSLKERIVITAMLEGDAVPQIKGQQELREKAAKTDDGDGEGATIDGGLSGERVSRWPAVYWGLVCALIWLATWLVQVLLRRRARKQADADGPSRAQRLVTWAPYIVGLPIFLVALYVFFENFVRLLPGNY